MNSMLAEVGIGVKGRRTGFDGSKVRTIRKVLGGIAHFPRTDGGKLLLLSAVFLFFCFQLPAGGMLRLMEQAAVFSASLTMPEAGIEALRKRYQDILIPSSEAVPSMSEAVSSSSSAPIFVPEPVPETSSEPEPQEEETILSVKEELPLVVSEAPVVREIAPENRGTIVAQTFTAIDSPIYIQYGEGKIKNSTNLTNAQAEEILDIPCAIPVEDLSEPLVLIYHTHATEAYEPLDAQIYDKTYSWRSRDNTENMVAVGEVLAAKLEKAGIGVVHLTDQHDYPSYNGAYEKSAQSIKAALEQYPSIKVILDIHRDAIQRDADTIVKAVAEIEGKKAAQLMIVAGCDDDGSLGMPQWQSNFRFSAALQDILESMYPGLCRPVFFCYRKYNMDLCPNGALIEVGSHGNTLEEAKYAAELLANGLALLLKGQSF